ncbi:UNVERIFIED_CONTAM: hypothetical protein K2H54_060483 [Gekko kuhli]
MQGEGTFAVSFYHGRVWEECQGTAGYWERWEEKIPEAEKSVVDCVMYFKEWLEKTVSVVGENLAKAKVNQSCWYDKTARSLTSGLGDKDLGLHLEHLARVLGAIQEAGLSIKLEEWLFRMPEVVFLRYRVGSGSIPPIKNKGRLCETTAPSHPRERIVRSAGGFEMNLRHFGKVPAEFTRPEANA